MKSVEIKRREDLKKKLVWGDLGKISQVARVERTTVYNWFKGKTDHPKIEPVIQAVIKKREEDLQKQIDELL